MALMNQPVGFAYCSENLTIASIAAGTNFTAAANDADGAAVQVLAALGHDVHNLCFEITGVGLSTADGQAYADILIDPAGGSSWSVLINDVACGFAPTAVTAAQAFVHRYQFPIWIPSGATVGIRAKTHHTADITTGQIIMSAYGCPRCPDAWWCGSAVETLGNTDSRGTAVATAAAGAFGSWVSIGGTTAARYGALQLGINGSDATANGVAYLFQAGYGSVQVPGSNTLYAQLGTAEQGIRANQSPWFVDIASGTQMQVRGGGSTGSFETLYCTLYGVY